MATSQAFASGTQTATFKVKATAAEFALWEKLTQENTAAAASGTRPKGKGKRPAPTTDGSVTVFLESFRDSVLSKAREHCVVVEASQTDAERARRWCTDMLRVKQEVDEAAERVKRLRATVPLAAAARVREFLAAESAHVDADDDAAAALPGGADGSGSASTGRGAAADDEAKLGMDPKELLPLLRDVQKTLRNLPKPLKAAEKRAEELQKGLESNVKAVKGSLASGGSATEALLSKAPPERPPAAAAAAAASVDATEEEASGAEAAVGSARSDAAAGKASGPSAEEARIAATKRVREEAAAAPLGRFLQRMG